MKNKYPPLIILSFLLITTLPLLDLSPISTAAAQGSTFYVATDGNNGTGDGSSGNPWATITYAVDNVPDDSLILVRPGDYTGLVGLSQEFTQGITIRSEIPYQARLRYNNTVVRCYYCKGITLEGFDIAHSGPGSGALVIQIQDLIGDPGGADFVSRVTLRNNILHGSYNNDILKINSSKNSQPHPFITDQPDFIDYHPQLTYN